MVHPAGGYTEACADPETGIACPPGMFLRDKSSCVMVADCNCYLPNGMAAPVSHMTNFSDALCVLFIY